MVIRMNSDVEKASKKIKKVALILFIVFFSCLVVIGGISFFMMMPINSSNNDEVMFNVESGTSKNQIISDLKKEGLIRNTNFTKILVKLNYRKGFLAGNYKLSKSMTLMEILESLTNGTNIEKNEMAITFIEGKRFIEYADVLANNLTFTKEEVISTCKDKDYLTSLIEKYWFITDDILKDGVYYPLEGYLFPDTYFIKKDATVKEAIEVLLNEMNTKLSTYKEYIETNNLNITSLLTLASVIELEASSESDRKEISGVFQNRIKNNMSIGSDVTTYYGVKKELGSAILQSDIDACNAYNTRGTCTKGIPIGPICSPSIVSIDAAINPSTNDYFYFVADAKGKVYYNKTASEHERTVADLKSKGLWS